MLGIDGAIFAAATHSLAKALLFTCLSGPEADGALDGEHTGLATRYPVAPSASSSECWPCWAFRHNGIHRPLAALRDCVQIWPLLATVFILSSIFALIAYVLALTRVWWGPPGEPHPLPTPPHPMKEPIRVCKL